MNNGDTALVLWRYFDGKPGHDRQSAGLAKALHEIRPVQQHDFDARECQISRLDFLRRRLPFAEDRPKPDLIIGAGRRCQWPLLASRRARGGRAVYLMRPQLPLKFFDLCVVPQHDRIGDHPHAVGSVGVLNDIEPASANASDGLILIGGPSTHFGWNDDNLMQQLRSILDAAPDKTWRITDSRRTPASTSIRLGRLGTKQIEFFPHTALASDWLTDAFSKSDQIWVTQDSVSMVYESLSTGAAIGLLNAPAKKRDRISAIAEDLSARGFVTRFDAWRDGADFRRHAPLDEAARIAKLILARWP